MIDNDITYTIDPQFLQAWLRDRLSETTQNKLARDMEISRPILGEILQGRSKLKGSTIKAFAKKMRISPDKLLGHLTTEYSDFTRDDLAFIPVFDIEAAAGAGSYAGDIVQIVGLEKMWLRKEYGATDSLEGIRVSGDSMEPTLFDGDVVLVDRNDAMPKDGVYVLRIEDNLFVKRLSRLPNNKIEVISDNPSYSKYAIDLKKPPTNFQVIGRVLMKCQKI